MAGLNARSHSASKSISAKPCPTGASVFFFPNGITMKQIRRSVTLTSRLLDRRERARQPSLRDHADLIADLLREPPRLGSPLRTPEGIQRAGQGRVAIDEEGPHAEASGEVNGALEHLDRSGSG